MSNQFNGGNTQTYSPPRGVDQAREAGKDIQSAAADLVGASADLIKKEASELAGVAKIAAAEAGDRLQSQVGRQKQAGAEYIGNLADTMRRAAIEFEADTPIAATYIRKAAAQVDSVADAVREGDFNDLVRGAQSFAQRQPTAFLGLTVLAGFGVMRFLKSSSERGHQERDDGAAGGAANFDRASGSDFGAAV